MTGDDTGRAETGEPNETVESDDDPTDDAAGDAPPRKSPGETPLLLDVMLGKLATYLRMCGYDAAYAGTRGAETDDDALAVAETEGRTLVTRDHALATRADPSLLLSSRDPVDQLRELAAAGYDLTLAETPSHCSACNGRLERVDRTEPTPDYAPAPHEETVWRCRDCGQHFWKGSHWDDVAATLADL
jgi:uncharacterized protein with PIN domain